MRLIDADALISFIDPEHLRHSGELTFSEVDVINMLNHAPTAFDVDKVVEQLDTYITKLVGRNSALYQTVMQIVKGGGVEK